MAKKAATKSLSRKEKPAPMVDAAREREVTRLMHTEFLPGIVYEKALAPLLGDGLQSRASDHARDTISRMAPRDPVEEMLVAQLLFTHARVIRLSELANQQSGLDAIRVMNEYADRASNTYRRLAMALAEYRRPARTSGPGDSFTVVKQANFAHQQVIQSHEIQSKNATNEQGFNAGLHQPASAGAAIVQPIAEGVGCVASIGPEHETVGAIKRPANGRRKNTVATQRDKARRAID